MTTSMAKAPNVRAVGAPGRRTVYSMAIVVACATLSTGRALATAEDGEPAAADAGAGSVHAAAAPANRGAVLASLTETGPELSRFRFGPASGSIDLMPSSSPAAPQDERDVRDAGSDADVAALDLNDAGGWEFRVDPYLWMANIDGTVGGMGATVDVDPRFFDEILDNFDAGGFLGIEGRRDRFFAFGNLNFMELSGDVRPGRSLLDEYDIGTFLSGVDLNIPTPQPPGILPPRLEAIVQQLIADRVTEVKQEVIEALEGVTLGPRLDKVDWDVELLMVEFAVGYHLGEWELGDADGPEPESGAVYMVQSDPFASPDWPVLSVDLYAGARYWDIKWELDLDITPGVLAIVPSSVSKGRSTNWIDPLVGARMDLAFSEDLSLMLRGDIGGFGVGSDLGWQVVAGLDWQVNDHMSIGAGYRVVDVDYSEGSGADRTELDLKFLGPYIGASIAF